MGIQMKLKELTFMMISNLEKPLVSMVYKKIFQCFKSFKTLMTLILHFLICDCCFVKITLFCYVKKISDKD